MACNYKTLASSGPFQVQSCRCCGGISIHLGAFTVRLDPASMTALHQTLARAVAELGSVDASLSPPLEGPAGSTTVN